MYVYTTSKQVRLMLGQDVILLMILFYTIFSLKNKIIGIATDYSLFFVLIYTKMQLEIAGAINMPCELYS